MPSQKKHDTATISDSSIIPIERLDGVRAFVDLAITTEDRKLVVIGWIFDPKERVRGMALLQAQDRESAETDTGRGGLGSWLTTAVHRGGRRTSRQYLKLPIDHNVEGMQMVRVPRPDVTSAMGSIEKSHSDMHGFIVVIPLAPDNAELALETADERCALLSFTPVSTANDIVKGLRQLTSLPQQTLLTTLRAGIGDDHPLFAIVRDMPDESRAGSIAPVKSALARIKKKAQARMGTVLADLSHLPSFIERPETVLASVDGGYPLGDAGILFFGWYFCPKRNPVSISVYDEFGNPTPVETKMAKLARLDVVHAYKQRFPNVDGMCGFACLAPVPTAGGEARGLCFDFGDFGETWMKVPSDKPDLSGLALAKNMLGLVADPAQVRNRLYDIFDHVLGPAVERVIGARRSVKDEIDVLAFGSPPEHPSVSVVVPLYGRYDFVRHQLAHFADDADFRNTDLIYVVDDPGITAPTLDLAAKYHELFGVPFRIVWYGENRGYAGANNIGARFARGRHLVLLNSDVIPQHAGWLSMLSEALDTLPDAGAVGPLLQFGDGSIQHAGMYPRTDAAWPGFILNTHKHMGMAWQGGNGPVEHPMLTAACIMMRSEDFNRIGGFDENYVIGDFEDSDLCLSLRKLGRRLYLVPEARLWHLERQSQNLDSLAGHRQIVTLFNGWRYTRKIRQGELVDPMTLEVNS